MTSSDDEIRVMENGLAALLAQANHLLTQGLHKQIKRRGLTITQWRVLAALSERDGITMAKLAKMVLLKQPTLTKAIDRMEEAHLVQRRIQLEDRRRIEIHITESGQRVVTPLLTRARAHERSMRNIVGEASSRALEAALRALIERLSAYQRHNLPRNGTRPKQISALL